VCLALSAAALAFPLHGFAAGQWRHEWTHHGTGRTNGPEFHGRRGAHIHWYMQWNCPHGPGYGMHVDLDYRSFNIFGETRWYYEKKVYGYGPPNNHGSDEGVSKSGVVVIDSTKDYRMSFHAANACRYALRARWD
jgi:hypothetical protein